MSTPLRSRLDARSKNAVVFVAAMIVGVMAYTGELVYTPVVVVLLLLAVGIGKFGSE
jgi:hypothetical protein